MSRHAVPRVALKDEGCRIFVGYSPDSGGFWWSSATPEGESLGGMDLPSLFALVDDSKLDVDWAQAHDLLRTLDQDAAWVAHACSQGPGAEITSILRQALEPQLHV